MGEKMTEKERLELSIQLLNASNLIEIRDLLMDIQSHFRAWPEEKLRRSGMSELSSELDDFQLEGIGRVLKELRLPALQAALDAALLDADWGDSAED